MTKLVINKGAVIKQHAPGTARVINAHDQHSSREQPGLGESQSYYLPRLIFYIC